MSKKSVSGAVPDLVKILFPEIPHWPLAWVAGPHGTVDLHPAVHPANVTRNIAPHVGADLISSDGFIDAVFYSEGTDFLLDAK